MEIAGGKRSHEKSAVISLPFVNLQPSNPTKNYTCLHFAAEEYRKQQQKSILIFDQPLFIKAMDIVFQSDESDMLCMDIMRLGGFYLLMTYVVTSEDDLEDHLRYKLAPYPQSLFDNVTLCTGTKSDIIQAPSDANVLVVETAKTEAKSGRTAVVGTHLIFIHDLMRCDTTYAFYNRGPLSGFKKLQNDRVEAVFYNLNVMQNYVAAAEWGWNVKRGQYSPILSTLSSCAKNCECRRSSLPCSSMTVNVWENSASVEIFRTQKMKSMSTTARPMNLLS
ncbi:hypothetical protein PR048_013418 [Dryococelus australis]|uniref:Uncharacterized protein n=1 Tax=Dryococelus australis TaxID=614101 RepID=A0ABQ9HS48_9NEOP|nr:hypothetical protein PR048_013418 [Dryococelus australis]